MRQPTTPSRLLQKIVKRLQPKEFQGAMLPLIFLGAKGYLGRMVGGVVGVGEKTKHNNIQPCGWMLGGDWVVGL